KGVDTTLFRAHGKNHRDALGLARARVIIAVARLVPIKNIRLLIEAMAQVTRDRPDAHLLVVGEGPAHAALERRTAELGLDRVVTFVGDVPHQDTAAYYRSADVFALSSEFDNSPNVVLEAMACGLPIVATDVGGVRDFVDVACGGAIVPAGDAGALAKTLARVLADIEAARRAGAHNRQLAVERYSWRVS